LSTIVTEIPPPVTAGVSANKCEAAGNGKIHIEDIITNVHNAKTGDLSLTDFIIAIATGLMGLIALWLSAGALALAVIEIFTAIFAAIHGVREMDITAFDDYWTSDERHKILCALYCTIGEDGRFTDAQYANFLNKWKTDAIGGDAFEGVYAQVQVIGRTGLNNLCAYGEGAGTDCTDCECFDPCDLSQWSVDPSDDGTNGVIDSFDMEAGTITVSSTSPKSDGKYYVVFSTSRLHGANSGCYCNSNLTCNFTDRGTAWEPEILSGGLMQNHCVNHVGLVHDDPFTDTISFGECP
jgi:hypothetical protein